jgi:hypothetical protein
MNDRCWHWHRFARELAKAEADRPWRQLDQAYRPGVARIIG